MKLISEKLVAKYFLNLCAKGKSRIAFEKFASKNFIHHNIYFKGDSKTIMLAMEESYNQYPNKILKFKHIIEDKNIVAIHSHIRQHKNDLGYAVMHIFKFQKNKIVEMWDFGQAVPKKTINKNGMF